MAQRVRNLPAMQEPQKTDPLEEGMTTHSSMLAWRIPWTGARRATLQSRKTVKHDYSDLTQAESVAKSLVHSHFFKFTHLMFESNKIFFKHLSPWWL